MTDQSKIKTTEKTEATPAMPHVATGMGAVAGLFDEMQALMALMPGASLAAGEPLSTDEETEAMFDNMPV